VNFQSGFPLGTRLPAKMHSTLQWQVGRQAGMTEWVGFGIVSEAESYFQFSTFNFQFSIFNFQFSIFNFPFSTS
jgi:hypothetical protein